MLKKKLFSIVVLCAVLVVAVVYGKVMSSQNKLPSTLSQAQNQKAGKNTHKEVKSTQPFVRITAVRVGSTTIPVILASSPDDRTRGLSGRQSLPEKEGMLFAFPQADFHGFWMKDMNFPIDIVWINEQMKVVYLKENVQPQTFPEIFKPDQKALYVLEVNAGFARSVGITDGGTLELITMEPISS